MLLPFYNAHLGMPGTESRGTEQSLCCGMILRLTAVGFRLYLRKSVHSRSDTRPMPCNSHTIYKMFSVVVFSLGGMSHQ